MAFDPASIPLPPPGAKLRLPPQSALSYEEAYQQVRRQLKDDGASEATMSVQMKAQLHAAHAHAEALRLREAD